MIFWIVYILAEAFLQYKSISKGNKPNYLQLAIIRGVFSILHGVLIDVQDIKEYGILVLWQITSFWLIFDPVLNKLRKKSFFYKGKTSGWLDKLPNPLYFYLKIFALLLMIIAYIAGLNIWII